LPHGLVIDTDHTDVEAVACQINEAIRARGLLGRPQAG